MKLLFTLSISFITLFSFSQTLEYTKVLSGKYECEQFKESMEVVPVNANSEEIEKGELFRVILKKKKLDDKTVVYREIRGSQLGEWYSSPEGQVYIRFSMNKEGQVLAELGNDKNYDQIIDPYRTFIHKGNVPTNQLVKFNGKTNEDHINGNIIGEQTRAKCEVEEAKLKEYFINNEEAEIYDAKNERLYVVSQIYGDHETFKGVLIKYTDMDGSYDITHKVDIWYQPNMDEYGCAFQIFKCGEKTKLEKYTVLFNDDKSMITLNGKGFKKVEE